MPYVSSNCGLECRQDLQRFVHDGLLSEWVRLITTRIRAADPNHLVASPRLALLRSDKSHFWTAPASPSTVCSADGGITWNCWKDSDHSLPNDSGDVKYCSFDLLGRTGNAGFDLVAVIVYDGDPTFEEPWFPDGIHKIMDQSGLPVMVSEFSVRARIEGWTNIGGANSFVSSVDNIEDQLQRGKHYQSQIDQLIGFREIVGANWHAWTDRYLANPGAGSQINMGLFRCDEPDGGHAGDPWTNALGPIRDTNQKIMKLIQQKTGF